VPDLPTAIWDDLVEAIAKWWSTHQPTEVLQTSSERSTELR
jgi:hypothetical protein